jgi:hypothetical protein
MAAGGAPTSPNGGRAVAWAEATLHIVMARTVPRMSARNDPMFMALVLVIFITRLQRSLYQALRPFAFHQDAFSVL